MKQKVSIILVNILFLIGLPLYSEGTSVQDGSIHISERKLYNLRGDWKFRLGDVENGESPELDDSDWDRIKYPSLWSFQNIHHRGIAWHRLDVWIDPRLKDETFAFQVPNILEAHRVYFNGVLIGGSGKIDPSFQNFISNPKSDYYSIDTDIINFNGKNTLSIQAQNRYSIGGSNNEVFFGPLELVKKNFFTSIIIISAFSVSFAVLSLYIFMGYFGLKDIGNIYGSLFFLCFSILIFKFFELESWFLEDSFYLYYPLFTVSFGGVYFFQFLLLKTEYKYPFLNWEKWMVLTYMVVFILSLVPLVYPPFFVIRNTYLIQSMTLFHIIFQTYSLYYSVRVLLDRKFTLYPFSIGSVIAYPIIISDYFIIFNIKDYHQVNSLYAAGILLFSYSINLTLKEHNFYNKLLSLEKAYSEKLVEEIREKTSELVQTNQALNQSNRLKTKLFTIIAHDLRSPLDALNQIVSLFKNEQITDSSFKNHIASLVNNLERNQFLVENLLHWSYEQIKSDVLRREDIELNHLFHEIYDIMLQSAMDKSIDLQCTTEKMDHTLFSNPNSISLVVINLLHNSIKFTAPKGKIEFGFVIENQTTKVFVRDTGLGIDFSKLELIQGDQFVPSTTGTNQEKGSGIGLMICKEILKKLGSTLLVKSEPQKGTEFSFYLS